MNGVLIKIRSNHNNIADRYTGIVEMLPKVGESFVMFLRMDGYVKTTPVTVVNRLSDKVIEFETKNSKYSLELIA